MYEGFSWAELVSQYKPARTNMISVQSLTPSRFMDSAVLNQQLDFHLLIVPLITVSN